ncbi:MAG: phage terminase small subunit [Cellvibrionaceae bacterium]
MPLITKQHQQRCVAKQTALDEGKSEAQAQSVAFVKTKATEHDRQVLLSALDQDLDRLGALESVAEKIKLKRDELLPKYLPHVDAYLESGASYPNAMLVRCAIWCLDVEDLDNTIRLVDECIKQHQDSPANFSRDLSGFFIEQVAAWADGQLQKGDSGSPYIDQVCLRVSDGAWPTTNIIGKGKAFKVAGQLAEKNGDKKEALEYYRQAQEANDKAGCKGRIKELAKTLGDNAQ